MAERESENPERSPTVIEANRIVELHKKESALKKYIYEKNELNKELSSVSVELWLILNIIKDKKKIVRGSMTLILIRFVKLQTSWF